MRPLLACLILSALPVLLPQLLAEPQAQWRVTEEVELGLVPAGFPVGFCLLSTPERQYVAYYDQQRRMTVASRRIHAKEWQRKVLPSTIGWDSHNYVTMAVDGEGHLHVSGNMHNDPLVYFRTRTAGDIATLQAEPMTGKLEKRVTYPRFMKDAGGRLLFTYRHGGSGNGFNLWNRYDPAQKSWSRLLDVPLLDGQGMTNAYPTLPRRNGDWFHMIWVWRDTPDCATNHHLSYARSRDMVNWESAFGDAQKLPLTIERPELWVDPAPAGSGMINGGQELTFDSKGRPLVVYHRADGNGHMQLYAARPEGGTWQRQVLTQWQQAVPFGGNGSMGFIGISIRELSRVTKGVLAVSYRHKDYGVGHIAFDEESLKPLDGVALPPARDPRQVSRKRGQFPGLAIRRAEDSGDSGEKHVRYLLVWETLGPNHDRPRQEPLPEPSMLRLYRLQLK